MNSAALYTPTVLALATGLANWPWDDSLPLVAEARSRSCGSSIKLGIALDSHAAIERIAVRSQACAIGQAAAAVFAGAAIGRDAAAIRNAEQAVRDWLAGTAPLPDWPGFEELALARDYPGRHGAILLAWQAASELLP